MIDCTPLDDGAHGPPLTWVSTLLAAARAQRLSWSVLWEVLLAHLESDDRTAESAIAALLEHVREPRDLASEALRLQLLIETTGHGDATERISASVPHASAPPATSQVDGPARAPSHHRSDSDWFVLLEPAAR